MEQKFMYDLHAEHKEWLNKLAFYKDEIKMMRERLSEVAGKNSNKEVLALVEHFENQLTVQAEQHDIIRHEVKQYENVIQDALMKNDTAADHRKMDDQVNLRDAVDTFEKIFNDLRKELIGFLAKWM